MSDFLNVWFQGFEKGINAMDQKEREKLFCQCGRKCADTGIINMYKDLFKASGNNMDTFFTKLNESEYIGGDIINPGKVYEITFPQCYCDLHTQGYINSDCICECSRQSIIYVMNTLEPELEFQVDKITTVLGGDKECRFRVSIINC